MFTSLSVIRLQRKKLHEKLHIVRTRRFISSIREYGGTDFYTTGLFSYSENNQHSIEKFCRRCRVPVIFSDSEITVKYKYLAMANTLFELFPDNPPDTSICDNDGELLHLLPKMLSKSRTVYVFTGRPDLYETESNRLFSLIGAAAIISDNLQLANRCDAIVDSTAHFSGVNPITFGNASGALSCRNLILPKELDVLLEPYDDRESICAGLFYSAGIAKLGHLKYHDIVFGNKIIPPRHLIRHL